MVGIDLDALNGVDTLSHCISLEIIRHSSQC